MTNVDDVGDVIPDKHKIHVDDDEPLVLPPHILHDASSPMAESGSVIPGFGNMMAASSSAAIFSPSPIKKECDEPKDYHRSGEGTLDAAVVAVAPMRSDNVEFPHLEHLCLSRCCIGELSGMRNVDDGTTAVASMSHTRLHDVGIHSEKVPANNSDEHQRNSNRKKSVFSCLKGLVTLDLSHNELVHAESALAGLGELPRLSAINLSHNRLQRCVFTYVSVWACEITRILDCTISSSALYLLMTKALSIALPFSKQYEHEIAHK